MFFTTYNVLLSLLWYGNKQASVLTWTGFLQKKNTFQCQNFEYRTLLLGPFFFLAELENSPRMYNLHHILLNYQFSK